MERLVQYLMMTFVSATFAYGQGEGNVWYFGLGAGLDFNDSPPTVLEDGQTYWPLPSQWNEGTSSICDAAGNLLFYTNGVKVWKADHSIIFNGDSLCGHPSSAQAALIVPLPGSTRYYYIFTTDAQENQFLHGLSYSKVDMLLDGGNGGVMADEKNVSLNPDAAEKLAAVRHSNGIDYWIVSHGRGTDVFFAYRLTPDGIYPAAIESAVGEVDIQGAGGQITFSPSGDRLAYVTLPISGHLGLYDFDRSTGLVSSPRILMNSIYSDLSQGVVFSPDNSKMYVMTGNNSKVFQYDLTLDWQTAIDERTILAESPTGRWSYGKIGPDNKIYIAKHGRSYMAVIEFPDQLGAQCQFVDSAIYLGTATCSIGLPNHVAGYDYSISGQNGLEEMEALEVSIHPNPTNGLFNMDLGSLHEDLRMELFDPAGRLCESFSRQVGSPQITVDLTGNSPGAYSLTFWNNDRFLGSRTVVLTE